MTNRLRRIWRTLNDWGQAGRDMAAAGYGQLRRATASPPRQTPCSRYPVVVLPGVLEPWRYLSPLSDWLGRIGHPVHVVTQLGWNLQDLDTAANHVHHAIDENELDGVVLVAHSKGGLIGKQVLASNPHVSGMVTVATPFAGASLGGRLQKLPGVGLSPFGMFRAGSPALTRLSQLNEVNNRIVSMAPSWDQVVPAESTVLEGGINIDLEAGGHFRPLRDPDVWELIHHHIHQRAKE